MKKELILKSGWLKLDKIEIDRIRKLIRTQYEIEGGTKPFNTHLPNYEELRVFIREKIKELKIKNDYDIKIQGQTTFDVVPGNTFFKDLFYSRRKLEFAQFQEYNIDVCYLYVFGKTRYEQKRSEKRGFELTLEEMDTLHKIKILVSSTLNNMTEAEKIKEHIKEKFSYEAESDIRNSPAFSRGNLSEMYKGLSESEYVFMLFSRDYLQNENCIKELIEVIRKTPELYLKHTFHILLKDIYSGDFNIFDSLGRSELLKYWMLRFEKLEENHKILLSASHDGRQRELFTKLRQELDEIKQIVEELSNLIDLIRENKSSILYEIFLSKIDSVDELVKLLPGKEIVKIDDKLETAYKRIKIPSNNDPNNPEFPPAPFYRPRFPASQTFKINVPGFNNVYLKDESTNPTGTHKDRMAWEVVIKYKSLIEGLKYSQKDELPQMSIISSGSAAIAIQHLFNLFKIPVKLKVLVDKKLNTKVKEDIRNIGCQVYEFDLSEKLLTPEDIKELTDNKNGIDITYREVLDPTHDTYYDWMSYEILNVKPDYCFIPFGTGDLFINVLNIVKIEYLYSFVSRHDPRFSGDIDKMKGCHFLGASTNTPDSRFDKLFSYFLPSMASFKKYINELKEEYKCVGSLTGIYDVEEKFAEKAIDIAEKQKKFKFEPSGIAGLALLLQMKNQIPHNSKILIVNTGKTKSLDELKRT